MGQRVIKIYESKGKPVAVSALGRVCGGHSAVASHLVTTLKKKARAEKTKEAEELAGAARAVKGEVYVLQGQTTSALLDPLEQTLTVLRAVCVREPRPLAEDSTPGPAQEPPTEIPLSVSAEKPGDSELAPHTEASSAEAPPPVSVHDSPVEIVPPADDPADPSSPSSPTL